MFVALFDEMFINHYITLSKYTCLRQNRIGLK